MQIITVKCESCGASLKIDDTSNVVVCKYCGTSLRLLRKETPPTPSAQTSHSSANFQSFSYYTQIAKQASLLKKPSVIFSLVLLLISVAFAIILPIVIYNRTNPDITNPDIFNNEDTPPITSELPSNPISIVNSGEGDKVISDIKLPKGNFYAKLIHEGSSNFSVKFYYGSNQYDYVSLANKIGKYTGYALLSDVLGVAVTNGSLEIKANGYWIITIYEISETSGNSIAGKGDFVTGVISGHSGRKTITLTHNGSSNFAVKIYTYNGGKYDYALLANKIGSYSGQSSVSFSVNSKYYFSIQADGDWAISIN